MPTAPILARENAMSYTLEQLASDIKATLKADPSVSGRQKVCGMVSKACLDKEFVANLIPNSHLVAAGVVAVNRSQEYGYTLLTASCSSNGELHLASWRAKGVADK